MRVLAVAGLVVLSGCGGGGTTGTNYSDPPPMAEIVSTPSPQASPGDESAISNAAGEDAALPDIDASEPSNAM